jgi:tRNA(Ile)-lysidine synthase
MNLYSKFKNIVSEWHKNNLSIKNIIVGFSGGPDSTSLLMLFKKYADESGSINVIAAHVFHDWGKVDKAFEKDEVMFKEHCIKICKKININLEIYNGKLDDFIKFGNGSLEASGRAMRRSFFEDLMQKHSNSIVALAHTLDDNIETFFIKLIRGSSIGGLSCMDMFDGKFLRPLLGIEKTEILEFLNEKNISYVNDPSNSDCRFLRCKIRNELLPLVNKIDKRFKNSIQKTIFRMSESRDLMDDLANENIDFDSKKINLKKFAVLPKILQKTIISKLLFFCNYDNSNITENLLDEIIRFIDNKRSAIHIIGSIRATKKNGVFYIKRMQQKIY